MYNIIHIFHTFYKLYIIIYIIKYNRRKIVSRCYPVLCAKSSPATRNVVKLNSLKFVLSDELWSPNNGCRGNLSRTRLT